MASPRLRVIASTIAASVVLPAVATATPFSAGASIGRVQSADDADNTDPNTTWGLWGRVRAASLLSAQLELSKFDNDSGQSLGSLAALAVVDLVRQGHFVPILVVGVGYDWASSQTGTDLAVGAGLEYRTGDGFIVGVDARIGTRSVSSLGEPTHPACGDCIAFVPSELRDGQFRAIRLAVGVHF